MIYSHYYYSHPCSLFAWVLSWICSRWNAIARCSTTSTTIDSVATRSDLTPHTLHPAADDHASLQPNRFSPQRNHPSNIQHTKSMNILSPLNITTRAQWHAWFDQRRIKLKHRLEQAEQAEWNWPSTRRRCDIMRIEDEIRRLDAEEFVTPF